LWPPQRGVGLQEPNLGKTNPRVTLFICLRFVLRPLLRTHLLSLTLTPACSCDYFCKFQFRPIHPPPLGDYQPPRRGPRLPARGIPAPGGAASWPPRARPLSPLRAAVSASVCGPYPRQRGPLARPLRAARVASARPARPRSPPFTQRVPSCAAPRAR
jgi:hypothetical protein